MKKIISSIVLIAIIATSQAQTDQRTATTKIADILAKAPSLNAQQLNANMSLLEGIGSQGLSELVSMLAPKGNGDNTSVQFTINSYSYYVVQHGKETDRQSAEKVYSAALEKISDRENKAFLIRQIQIVGSDYAVNFLKAYLSDERLCDDAARTLVKINSSNAGKALLAALPQSSGKCRITLVEALGEMNAKGSAPAISNLADGSDLMLKKVSLFALANIADPVSQNVFTKAVKKASYSFDPANATSSYLKYILQLAKHGHVQLAIQLAKSLNKSASTIQTRSAALDALSKIEGSKSLPSLIAAMNDTSKIYRVAALKSASHLLNENTASQWAQQLAKTNGAAKAEIITMLGDGRATIALNSIQKYVNDSDATIRAAAIRSVGLIGNEKAIPALLTALKNGQPSDIDTIKSSLLTLKGAGVPEAVSKALSGVNGKAKAALIEVLARRGYKNSAGDFIKLTGDSDSMVANSAARGLAAVVGPGNLLDLFSLLTTSKNESQTSSLQQAIVSVLSVENKGEKRDEIVLKELAKAPIDKQPLFYNIIAESCGPAGIKQLSAAFASGNDRTRKAAAEALANWKDTSSAEELFVACLATKGSPYFDTALNGYIKLANNASVTPDERLIRLRRAMDVSVSGTQKTDILQQVGSCKTFLALVFAGQYLDDAALQSTAAVTVMDLVMSNPEWNGAVVKGLLEKISPLLKGGDADYQRQAITKRLAEMPAGEGFVPIFNGKDLTGWKGLVADPIKRSTMNDAQLAKEQAKADEIMRTGWKVSEGNLVFTGKGENLCTIKKYGDIEMFVDWKIQSQGDAGIYLRGTPQVQIWDTSRTDVGAEVGSGGLYNNKIHLSKPLKLADNAIGTWNTFHILMNGDNVTVYLNGILVVDNIPLENYWDAKMPLFPTEQLELQAHGTEVAYRDIYVREIPRPEPFKLNTEEQQQGFKVLFDGTNLNEWVGNKQGYAVENGVIAVKPNGGSGGNLYTKDEYKDFIYRFEFQLTPGANNGIGIRAPLEGDAAYVGMEIQVLDNDADIYKNLHEYQYHGSVYGVIPAKRGYLKPLGEWNAEEIIANGNKIKVTLNGVVIMDGDITDAIKNGTLDKKEHPGLKNTTGHIGFLGHGDVVHFRNIRVKNL